MDIPVKQVHTPHNGDRTKQQNTKATKMHNTENYEDEQLLWSDTRCVIYGKFL